MSDTPLPDPQHDLLVDVLVQTGFTVAALLSRIGTERELSLTQLRLIGVLRDRQVRMSVLAGHLGLERSTVSGLVDRASHRGLLRRSAAADDGRAVEVTVSRAGADLADAVYTRVEDELSSRLDRLSASERERLTGLLRKVLDP